MAFVPKLSYNSGSILIKQKQTHTHTKSKSEEEKELIFTEALVSARKLT